MTDQPSRAGGRKQTRHNVVAVYPSVEHAREAITHLERSGVEGSDIELMGAGADGASVPTTNQAQRATDMAVSGTVAKRSLTGIVLGVVLGAAVLALVGWLVHEVFDVGDSAGEVVIGAAVAGAIFGAFGGLFYGGATGLPVSDSWGDTFQVVTEGSTGVAVRTEDDAAADSAIKALRHLGGHTRLTRFGPDGRSRDL